MFDYTKPFLCLTVPIVSRETIVLVLNQSQGEMYICNSSDLVR